MAYLWLWVSMAAITAAGLFLKEATLIVGEASENSSELPGWMLRLVSNPYTLAALFFFVLSQIGFVVPFSRLKLSYIQPSCTAIGLILSPIFALLLFEEKVPWLGWLGIVIMCVGVFLVSIRGGGSDSAL